MIARAVFSMALLFAATPASAGWQWTQWGMTPAQVIQASTPGTVGPYRDPKLDTLTSSVQLVSTYHTRTLAFSVALLFDQRSQGLSQVRMMLNGDDRNHLMCADLYEEMQRQYGDPDVAAPREVSVWRDTAHGNLVTLEVSGSCWLVYEPIPTKESTGL